MESFTTNKGSPGRVLACDINPESSLGGWVWFQARLANGRWVCLDISLNRFTERMGFTPEAQSLRGH